MPVIDFPVPCDVEPPEPAKRLDQIQWPLNGSDGLGEPFGVSGDRGIREPSNSGLSPAATICIEAASLLDGDRAIKHGDKISQHKTMARLLSAYLEIEVTASQAAMIELLLKVSRSKHGVLNDDDYRDGAAYLGIAWECADAGC